MPWTPRAGRGHHLDVEKLRPPGSTSPWLRRAAIGGQDFLPRPTPRSPPKIDQTLSRIRSRRPVRVPPPRYRCRPRSWPGRPPGRSQREPWALEQAITGDSAAPDREVRKGIYRPLPWATNPADPGPPKIDGGGFPGGLFGDRGWGRELAGGAVAVVDDADRGANGKSAGADDLDSRETLDSVYTGVPRLPGFRVGRSPNEGRIRACRPPVVRPLRANPRRPPQILPSLGPDGAASSCLRAPG